MTWAEAAENRRRCYKYLTECKHATPENVEANRLAVEALERMMPEQMIDVRTTEWGEEKNMLFGVCPNCGTLCSENYSKDFPAVIFCKRCGKAMTP